MSRTRTSLLILLALILLALAGPRVSVDDSWDEVTPGEDLSAWIADGEAAYSDIRPEAEKRIVWADSAGIKSDIVVVYIHGFSASRKETAPFADSIAAALHANLFLTRVAGHGRTGDALGGSTAHEWMQSTVEAIRVAEMLGNKIVLIATSNGAALTLWAMMQSELSRNVSAQILISPNIAPADPSSKLLLWPWGRTILRVVQGDTYSWEPRNDLQRDYATYEYPSQVLLELMGFVDLVQDLEFESLNLPTLMIYSPDDQVVDITRSVDMFERLGSASKDSVIVRHALDPSSHVLVGDAMGPENTEWVSERTLAFMRNVLAAENR